MKLEPLIIHKLLLRPCLHWSQMERFQMEQIQNWYEWALHLQWNRWDRSIWTHYPCCFGLGAGTVPFGSSVNWQIQMEQIQKRTDFHAPNTKENWIFVIEYTFP